MCETTGSNVPPDQGVIIAFTCFVAVSGLSVSRSDRGTYVSATYNRLDKFSIAKYVVEQAMLLLTDVTITHHQAFSAPFSPLLPFFLYPYQGETYASGGRRKRMMIPSVTVILNDGIM